MANEIPPVLKKHGFFCRWTKWSHAELVQLSRADSSEISAWQQYRVCLNCNRVDYKYQSITPTPAS